MIARWMRYAKRTVERAVSKPLEREPLRAPKIDVRPGQEIATKVIEFEQAAARNRQVVSQGEEMRELLSTTLAHVERGRPVQW